MRLLFAGTPEVAVPSLRSLLEAGHDVVAVLTRPDAAAGRGRRLSTSPVAELAAAEGIEVLRPARPSDPEFLAREGKLGRSYGCFSTAHTDLPMLRERMGEGRLLFAYA